MNKAINLLGVNISNVSWKETLEYFIENATTDGEKRFVVTLNAEILTAGYRNSDYKNVLNSADLALAESAGVAIGAQIMGKTLKDRIPGVDLVEKVCYEVSKRPITVGFLGGKQNVAEEAASCLRKKYPGLKIAFAISEWPDSEAKSQELKCDILFVAFGHPKQEQWISTHLPNIDVKIAMGVGGAFDLLSGRVPRAPKIMRKVGFEWFFRLLVQPWRVRRQSSLIYFVLLIFAQRLGLIKSGN